MIGLSPEYVIHVLGRLDEFLKNLLLFVVQELLVESDYCRGVFGHTVPDIRDLPEVARDSHFFFALAAGEKSKRKNQ